MSRDEQLARWWDGDVRPLYGFVNHPDENIGREHKRHLLDPGRREPRSLCGNKIRFVWGPNTVPLASDCRQCLRIAATAAARVKALRPVPQQAQQQVGRRGV